MDCLTQLYHAISVAATRIGNGRRAKENGRKKNLGFDSFSILCTIVLFKNQPFPQVLGGFLERRIPGKNGEVTPRKKGSFHQ